MKAHPQRKIRVQGKHFRGTAKTVAPLFLPEVTACCRKPKIHRHPTLVRAVWSGWTTTYFCTASVHAPALWAHLGPSSQTGIVSSCTPPPCVLAVAIWKGCSKQDLPLGMEGALRHLQRSSNARQLEGQAGWGMQDLSQNKYAAPSNAELLSALQELLSCGESLPPVHLRNSGKFLNPWEASCQFSACFTETVLQIY